MGDGWKRAVAAAKKSRKKVTYKDWISWCHKWKDKGLTHDPACPCGVPEPKPPFLKT